VAEPLRSVLIPGFEKIKRDALENGALGCGISGSGPTIFCLCRGHDNARKAGNSIQQDFASMNLKSEVFISPVNKQGAYVIE
jgi:homoserine kinase